MELNRFVANIGGSASMNLSKKANEMKEEGKDVINLAGGEPDFDTPKRIIDALKASLDAGETHYDIGPGMKTLREKISQKLYIENGIKTSIDNIVVTPGAKYALYLVFRTILNIGDEVIIFDPSWVSYHSIIEACGGRPIHIELTEDNNYAIDEEMVLSRISDKTKAMIINYPNNPTGVVLSQDNIKSIKNILNKSDVLLISDEIYEKIIFDNRVHVSPGSWKEFSDRIVTINGFSKSLAMTGWRVGYLAAPEYIVKCIKNLYAHTITGLSPFVQRGAIEALDCKEDIIEMNKKYEYRKNKIYLSLRELKNVVVNKPEGTFYLWMRFNNVDNSENAAQNLLSTTGIVGVPGSAYGAYRYPYVRVSFATSDHLIDKFIERMVATYK